MKANLKAAGWRLAVFFTVCSLGLFALVTVFAQLRFENTHTYKAEFSNVSGLKVGNFVRIAGVEVGKVSGIALKDDAKVIVDFTADDSVVLTEGTKSVIRYDNLIGGRFIALQEGPGSSRRLNPGATIPLDRTAPALDLDALIGGFRPLFRALNPEQVNALSGELIRAFQGEGGTIGSFLTQAGALTSTLADRDVLIGHVISNLNVVLGSLSGQSDKFATAVDTLAALVHTLAERKVDISTGLAYADHAGASIADLLQRGRPPLHETVAQTDRTAGLVAADHDYFDDLLNTLPDAYQALARQGLYGDFFSFYLCDMLFKVNGKGGQPVYIKVAGQDTGRCTPR